MNADLETDDRITEALTALIEAVAALGFDRARDAISAYGAAPNEDADAWHGVLIDMVHTAVGIAADASGYEGNDHWLAFGPEPGVSVRWAWSGQPDADFAGLILRSVHGLMGTDETKPAYVEALRMAIPVLRRTAAEYLECAMIDGAPATIAPSEWCEVAPDLEAILAAEACVGPHTDDASDWLDPLLAEKPWRQYQEELGA